MNNNFNLSQEQNIREVQKKGIILAGGSGKRLLPVTKSISKHLIPLYDKPMIYYPLSTLMLADTKEILLITTKKDKDRFFDLFGNGHHLGININYKIEEKPLGVNQAFILGEEFIGKDPVTLILGDNFFHGSELINKLLNSYVTNGAKIFIHPVKDPSSYGVIEIDKYKRVISIEEKPKVPKSKYAITGLYFFDNSVIEKSKSCTFSERGELEILDLLKLYLEEKKLKVEILGRGNAWLDTGTWESLLEASSFIRSIENRQGYKIGCPEEIAWRKGWINSKDLIKLSENYKENEYKNYLQDIANQS